MQTQCPHCKSRYRLSPEMIEAYGGFVRCGNCDYKFNVHDQVRLDDDYFKLSHEDALHEDHQSPAPGFDDSSGRGDRIEPKLDASEQDDALNIRFRPDEYEFEEDMPDSSEGVSEKLEPRFEFPSVEPEHQDTETEQQAEKKSPSPAPETEDIYQQIEPRVDESDSSASLDQASVEVDLDELSTSTELESERNTEEAHDPALRVDEADVSEDLPSLTESELDIDLDEWSDSENWDDDSNGRIEPRPPVFSDAQYAADIEPDDQRIEPSLSAPSLINDDAEDEDTRPGMFYLLLAAIGRFLAFSFWLLIALALAYLLFGQIRDRVYPAYKQNPVVQKIRSSVCGFVPCVDAKYDVDQYEIVVSRMDEVRAPERQLQVSIFLLNKAQHAQPYPKLLLTLKKIDGSIAGRRVITPENYTTSHSSMVSTGSAASTVTKMLIKPNKLGKILIKFDRPPADAVGFEVKVAP